MRSVNRNMVTVLIYVCLGVSCSVGAGEALTVKEPVYDFGTVKEGARISHAYRIVNSSRNPVAVKRAIVECACITASKKDFVIPPKGEVSLSFTFHSLGYGGQRVEKSMILLYGEGKQKLTMTMKGFVEGLPEEETVRIMPKEIHYLVNSRDDIVRHVLKMSLPDSDVKWRLKCPKFINAVTRVRKKSIPNSGNSKTIDIEVELELKPTEPYESKGHLLLETTVEHFETAKIPYTIEVMPRYLTRPAIIVMSPGQEKAIVLQILGANVPKTRGGNIPHAKSRTGRLKPIMRVTNECITIERVESEVDHEVHYYLTAQDYLNNIEYVEVVYAGQVVKKIPVIVARPRMAVQ